MLLIIRIMEAPSSSRFALPVSDELEELQEERRGTTIPYKACYCLLTINSVLAEDYM